MQKEIELTTEFEEKVKNLQLKIRALTPDAFLNANLAIAFAAMSTEQAFDKMFRKYGLSHKRFLMLHILMENGGSMTMPELSQRMYVSRQAIALTISYFEEQGIVVTSASEKDKRIKKITLTEKALQLITSISMSEYRMHVHNIIMSVVSEREANMLTDMLETLSLRLSTIAKAQPNNNKE